MHGLACVRVRAWVSVELLAWGLPHFNSLGGSGSLPT